MTTVCLNYRLLRGLLRRGITNHDSIGVAPDADFIVVFTVKVLHSRLRVVLWQNYHGGT